MALTRVAPAGIGSTPGTGYVIGDSFLHSTGLNATNAYYTGIVTTQTLRVIGDFQVDGTTTTLDTEVTSVDKLEVGANNNTVGVAITQSGTGDILNLYDSGTEVFSVTDGGKVKIGTTTEGQTQADDLTIATSGHTGMTIRSGTTSKGAIYFSDGTSGSSEYRGYVEYNHQDDFLRFGTAAVEKVRITSGGNVGINEDNPRHRLTVNSGTINVAIAVSSTDAGSYISYQDNTTGDTGTNSEVYAGALGGSFVIHTDAQNAPRVSVTNAGNVGINSTTPRAIVDFGPGTGNGTLNQTVANYQAVFEAPTGTGNYTRNIAFASRTSAISAAINAVDEGGSDATGLIVATGTAGSIAERLRITSSGNIGVNKTTPKEWYSTYKTLQIYDAAYIAGSSDDSFVAIGANNYLDTGGTYDYTNTDYASQLYQVDGQLVFRNAPSGTADTAITWAERFKVTSAGELNLSYGTINLGTADSSSGHINAYELMTFNIDSDNDDTNRHFTWYKNGASGGGTGMMRLDENGRLCIGGDLATSGNNLTLKHATGVEIDMHATSGSGNNFRVKSDSAGAFTIRDHSAGGDRLTITDSGDVLIGALTPIDTRNTGGIHIQHSRGISFRSNTTQSVSRNWRIRNDDYGWGNLDFSVGNAVDEWGDSAGDVVMSLTSNRNVGIGDLAPSEKLNVAGNIMLEGAEGFMYLSNAGTGNAGIYVRGNTSGSFLRSHSTGMFTWEVTGSEKMRLDAIGNLGLGCSPGNSAGYRTLQIGDGTNTGGQIWLKNGANANYYNWHDGTGVHFYGQSAGNLRFYTTATERFRIDSVGRALLGRQRTIGSGSYYDDLTINNSNTASGADGGAGIDLISGNDSWGGYIFSDSDAHARGYLKYDHGDDEMIFGTSSANRVTLDSGGRLLVGGSASTNPINANNTFALQVVGSYTNTGQQHGALFRYGENSANSSIIRFEKNRSNVGNNTSVQNGDNLGELQFYGVDNAGAYKLGAQIEAEVDGQNPANGTIPTRLVFKTTPAGTNNTPTERLRIRGDGSLEVNGSDFDDLIGCTGEHSGPNNTLYKTNSKTNLTTGTWYTIAILPSGRGFASFMIQDTSSSRHTCFYFNAGHQYGGNHNQNCINVIGCSGTHGTQVFGALRIKAYGTYDGAMLQVYIQSSVNQVKAYMVGENLAPQRWRMRDWIADGTDPTGLSNWSSIQSNASGLSAYADLNALAVGGASFSGPVLPGLNNIYVLGSGNRKWTTVYATTGSINTSDITLKRDVTVLNDAEMRAAANISKQFKQYRWKDAYAEKGDDARYHSGMMAQTVRDAMLGEGLDPTRYGFYCVDTWYEDPEGTKIDKFSPPGLSVDEDDPRFNTPDVGEPEIPENMSLVTGYSLRYEELLCFIAAYNEQRFASLESRLSALES
tara:strand:- start:53 stop:4252 length:4200 start_codon:yes stop_codon:yes gene_type:complete